MWLRKLFGLRLNTRRSKREKVDHVHDILFFYNDIAFKLLDMSMHGFALKDEGKFDFKLGETYQGTLEVFDKDRCPVRFTIARRQGGLIGCDVEESPSYRDFFNDFKHKTLEHRAEKKK